MGYTKWERICQRCLWDDDKPYKGSLEVYKQKKKDVFNDFNYFYSDNYENLKDEFEHLLMIFFSVCEYFQSPRNRIIARYDIARTLEELQKDEIFKEFFDKIKYQLFENVFCFVYDNTSKLKEFYCNHGLNDIETEYFELYYIEFVSIYIIDKVSREAFKDAVNKIVEMKDRKNKDDGT